MSMLLKGILMGAAVDDLLVLNTLASVDELKHLITKNA